MINKKLICELNEIIEKINSGSMSPEELGEAVEDVDLFLKIFKSINKNNLKNVTRREDRPKKRKPDDDVSYTRDEVYGIISSSTTEEILNKFTAEQVRKMFIAVYGKKPRSAQKKGEILSDIRDWFSTAERTEALSKL